MASDRRFALFRRTRVLESEIDEFLDNLSESGLVFRSAVRSYLEEGISSEFDRKMVQVAELESRNDHLRRTIEIQLYSQTLIPDSRGDVLGLLENLDSLLSKYEGGLYHFSIETPDIPTEFRTGFKNLADEGVSAVESLVLASRAFFRHAESVKDHIHKVMYHEKEGDRVGTALKRAIFATDLDLSQKQHLRYTCELVDDIGDTAEDVADRLAIYAIKRTI